MYSSSVLLSLSVWHVSRSYFPMLYITSPSARSHITLSPSAGCLWSDEHPLYQAFREG